MIRKLLKKETHGERYCYLMGCRCEKCTKANKEYTKKIRRNNKEKTNKYLRDYRNAKKTKV